MVCKNLSPLFRNLILSKLHSTYPAKPLKRFLESFNFFWEFEPKIFGWVVELHSLCPEEHFERLDFFEYFGIDEARICK